MSNESSFDNCICDEPGFCPLFNKIMTDNPPNWQWCQNCSKQERLKYLEKTKGSINISPENFTKSLLINKINQIALIYDKFDIYKSRYEKIYNNNFTSFEDIINTILKNVNQKNNTEVQIQDVIPHSQWPIWFNIDVDPPVNPKNKNLIITVAAGEFEKLIKYTYPLMELYAKKCHTDLILLTGQTQSYWGQEKFRIKKYCEAYENTLYLDIDIIIKPNSPDLFKILHNNISIHNDYPYMDITEAKTIEEDRKRFYHEINKIYLLEKVYNKGYCYNTGVVFTPKKYSSIWSPILNKFSKYHCDEQYYIESIILENNYEIDLLPTEFNCQWWLKKNKYFQQNKKDSYFLHYAGIKGKEKFDLLMKEIINY